MSESVVRWAMSSCSSGVAVTVVAALLLLPAHYYVPELAPPLEPRVPLASSPAPSAAAWLERALDLPPLDLFVTLTLLLMGLLTYLCEWIQRKIMEKRIVKLNEYLSSSLAWLRSWDSQQEQLETTLKLVQNATSEYNLLLYLLVRQHASAPRPAAAPPSSYCFDKELDAPLFVPNAPLVA